MIRKRLVVDLRGLSLGVLIRPRRLDLPEPFQVIAAFEPAAVFLPEFWTLIEPVSVPEVREAEPDLSFRSGSLGLAASAPEVARNPRRSTQIRPGGRARRSRASAAHHFYPTADPSPDLCPVHEFAAGKPRAGGRLRGACHL